MHRPSSSACTHTWGGALAEVLLEIPVPAPEGEAVLRGRVLRSDCCSEVRCALGGSRHRLAEPSEARPNLLQSAPLLARRPSWCPLFAFLAGSRPGQRPF